MEAGGRVDAVVPKGQSFIEYRTVYQVFQVLSSAVLWLPLSYLHL